MIFNRIVNISANTALYLSKLSIYMKRFVIAIGLGILWQTGYSQCLTNETVTANPVSLCGSGSSTITVGNSQSPAQYYLRNNSTLSVVDGPVSGGGQLDFNTGAISTTTTYQIYGELPDSAGALNFDGVNNIVQIPSSTAFNFGTGDFTIEAWVRTSKTALQSAVARFGTDGNGFALLTDNLGTYFYAGSTFHSATNVITDGVWHHIAGVRSGGSLSLYIDGVSTGPATPTTDGMATNGDLFIGEFDGTLGNIFQGEIDEVRIWNNARTGSQISSKKDNCLDSYTGLVAMYGMEEGSGTILTDLAGNHDGTLIGMTGTDWIGSGHVCSGCNGVLAQTITVTVNPIPDASFTGLSASYCSNDGIAILSPVTAGGTFSGSGISGADFIPSAANLGNNDVTYQVTVNGCTSSTTQSITVNATPDASFSGLATTYCEDDSPAVLSPITGGGTFSGAGISGNSFFPSVSGAGSFNVVYDVTVSGCSASSTQGTIVNDTPVLSFASTDVDCFGDGDGAIDLTVTGGDGNYTYSWNSGAFITEDLSGLNGGNYSIAVTDGNNCSASGSTLITEPSSALSVSVDATSNPTACTSTDGSISITVSGGTASGAYAYAWTDGVSFTSANEDLTGLSAGAYNVTVTDDNGCTATNSATLNDPSGPTVNVNTMNSTLALNCNGDMNGSVDVDVTLNGGATSATYSWDSGQTTEDIAGVSAGVYVITVTDNNNCQAITSATVSEPSSLLASGSSTNEINGNDGSIDISVSGGTAPYTYSWTGPNSFTSINEDPTGLAAGTYDVTVTDVNGCTTSAQVIVSSQVGILSVGEIRLHVFPNPCNGQFYIHSNLTHAIATVRDGLGREVMITSINSNQASINMEGYESGIYFLELKEDKHIRTVKIILQ